MTPGDERPWLPVALLLLQVPGCSSLRGPNSATGTVGGSLSVQCRYEEKFRETAKYWCKTPCLRDIVVTKEADKEVRTGRVSIRDHGANLTFTVTLENLTEDDAGTYRCGIDTSWLPGYMIDLTFRVVVSVSPGCFSLQGPESVRGLVGGSVTVQCYYTPGWKAYEKWWCRGAEWNSCQILVQTNGSEQEVKGDRVSIRDNQRHGLLTVTMEEVRRDDTDTYWCGISRNGPDLGASVKVTIDPADRVLSTPASPRSTTTTSGRAGASSDSYIRKPICRIFLYIQLSTKKP